ncbi:MAG: EAL domain-containing protein [Pseudomonadota bacterium]
MRLPPLAVVLIVSSFMFAWHGYDKFSSFKQLHVDSLKRALSRAQQSVVHKIEDMHAHGQGYSATWHYRQQDLRKHFPTASMHLVDARPEDLIEIFGSVDAQLACTKSPFHTQHSNSRLCLAEDGAPVLEIIQRASGKSSFVRYSNLWLLEQIQILNTNDYAFSTNFELAKEDGFSLSAPIENTGWIITVHSNERSINDVKLSIARDVTLALAVFLLLAATGMRFIELTKKRESHLEKLLSSAMRATGEIVWEYDFRSDTISIPFSGNDETQQTRWHSKQSTKQWLYLVHPKDRDSVAEALQLIKTSKHESIRCECRIRDGSGGWSWSEIHGNVSERDLNEAPSRAIGVLSDITSRKDREDKLDYLASQTANTTGGDFFDSLIQSISQVTSISHAFISELDDTNPASRRSVSFLIDGELLPTQDLTIKSTPCEKMFELGKVLTLTDGVVEEFPDCDLLKEWNSRAYIGIPLKSTDGDIIGNIGLFHREPLDLDHAILNALQLYSQRVAAELERLRSEHQHREREQLLNAICDNSPVGINVIDRDGTSLLANSRSITKLKNKLVLNDEIIDTRSSQVVEQLYRTVLDSGQTVTCEIEVTGDDGLIDTLLFIVFPLFNDHGKITRVGSITPSVAHVRSVERDLSSERERARVTLESIADAVITINAHGEIDYMNPVAESLTGIEKSDAFGRHFDEVFNIMVESAREQMNISNMFDNRSLPVLRDDCVLKTGLKEYSIRLSAAPIKDAEDNRVGVVVALSDTTQTRLIARRMAYQATHDALTGLDNRRQFENRLDQAILGARTHGNQHVLCYVDLDQFKLVNDDAGHIAGDALLKQIAALLSSKMRARDMLARIGGDEFALLLENCPLEKANQIAQNIVNAVAAHRFEWQGKTYRCGASIGITAINSYAENREQVLSQADIACYAAKDQGRNQINVYQEDGSEPARRHTEIRLAADIRDALEENRFHLHVQPIIDMRMSDVGQRISRCEVLLRMRGKHNDAITPNAFIPAAERYNLMADIDRWVIEKTLRTFAELAPTDRHFEVGINLSGSSLSDETLLDFVQSQLLKYGTNNVQICFEVTETAAISNLPNAHEFIRYMRKMGCSFALDDFGTGLSSFSYLKSLPVDYLKIDGSFIREIDRDPVDNAMVDAILRISRILKIPVIAEYAEREETVDHLRKMGVDFVQGSVLGSPCPMETYFKRETKTPVPLHPPASSIDKA